MTGILGATAIARVLTIVWWEPYILFKKKFKRPLADYFKQQVGIIGSNVLIVIISFALDIARIAFFYKLIHHFAAGTARATGLSTFGWMLGYVISILIGGVLFFAGEANGLLFGMGQKNESSILMNVFMTGCLVAFCHFII